MTGAQRRWRVRLAAAAERDFESIIAWTIEHFGEAQSIAYAETIGLAIEALAEGPSIPGAHDRDDILKGLRSLHVARQDRKGRHFVMFRVARGSTDVIEVLRLLHDSMDLPRHFSHDADKR
ncbi:MAG TPA: type II toxin-antitoxin system RelE/ParE family toxin [Povalibacter sp.]|uniref:type II toxin-antitoxin system RelE/ParE family toxin n=1 Tax=Povalibacter sp. TaxID=1962978 RepID=UPI002B89D9ED|nr:type II toxin-antitoxin system RelE/ParE family toxin [Povalibacter sp.]HMN47288.1 type II toxin-antitoxin system RelE/ParE family toxin [Povalibacter sp.]